jgi:hypothetical protein
MDFIRHGKLACTCHSSQNTHNIEIDMDRDTLLRIMGIEYGLLTDKGNRNDCYFY